MDIVSINRYFAWYGDTGRPEVIKYQIPTEVKSWFTHYKRPVLITEYGAGSIAGMHTVSHKNASQDISSANEEIV